MTRWTATAPVRTLLPVLLPVLLLACAAARAQDAAEPTLPPVNAAAQELYQEALQSIAEGRKQDANQALRRVIEQEPQHAGAWLDLALIQCSLGRPDEAERMFTTIEQRFAPPPGIVELIREARAMGCDSWTPLSQYSVTLSRGIDQNVNQGSTRVLAPEYTLSPEFQPQHDQYTMLAADYLRDLTPNGVLGFVQFQQRRNDSLRQYDSAALFAGVETPWRWGSWTMRVTALTGFITLGSQYYQRQYQLQARLGVPLKLPYGVEIHVLGGVSRLRYVTLDNFDATTGELRAQFSRRNGQSALTASAGLATDRAAGDRPGGDRNGSSASLQWRRRFGDGTTAELGYTLQHWRGNTPYAPGVIDQVREQDTHTLRATVTYPLNRRHNLIVEARQVVNKENIPIFQYNNRQLQLSWQWLGL